jgi:hypothetical protein
MATRLPCRPGPCLPPATAAATDAARRLRRPWRRHLYRRRPIWRRLSCTTAHLGDDDSGSVMDAAWANHARHQYPRRLCATHAAAQPAFPLAPAAGTAYVRRTQSSSPTHASTRLMDSHRPQMKYTLSCWRRFLSDGGPRQTELLRASQRTSNAV